VSVTGVTQAEQAAAEHPPVRSTLPRVVRSEWTKFWSVRSTMWTLLLVFFLTIGLGALFTWGTESTWEQAPPESRAGYDPAAISLAGLIFAQLAAAVLGAMVISTEYSTGGIRTTLTAVPRRLRVLTAKGIVLGVTTLVVGMITSFIAFFIGQAILGIGPDLQTVTLDQPDVLRAVIGGGLYVFACGMFGFALGTLLRHTAGSITIAVALLLVVPPLLNLLPGDWGDAINRYFTSNAGSQIMSVVQSPDSLSPWNGYLVFTLWWVVILAIAAWLMNRRDA
jgi:ABC-2 type transport system permease protein